MSKIWQWIAGSSLVVLVLALIRKSGADAVIRSQEKAFEKTKKENQRKGDKIDAEHSKMDTNDRMRDFLS